MTIHKIEGMADEAAALCMERMKAKDSAERVPVLLGYAYKKLDSEFELIDKLNTNFTNIVGDVETAVMLIREVRDEIHCTLRI